jgi:hypothetical protein
VCLEPIIAAVKYIVFQKSGISESRWNLSRAAFLSCISSLSVRFHRDGI